MIYGVAAVLFLVGAYFAVRYVSLSNSICKADEELKEIMEHLDANRSLKCAAPSDALEQLLTTVNQCLGGIQKERIQYLRREKGFRRQIENVSHDLRTPLTSIMGYLELIDPTHLDQEETEYIAIVTRKAKALQRLVGNFYDLSRLEANEYNLVQKKIDINKSLNELMLSYYRDFEHKKIEVSLDTGNKPVEIWGDEDAMERIFMNLIQNTLKYADSFLNVSLYHNQKQVNIVFENDTNELTEEEVSHLFERFYTKDHSRNNQSTGLGLTITKLLVENMQGTIEAKLENQKLQFILVFSMCE